MTAIQALLQNATFATDDVFSFISSPVTSRCGVPFRFFDPLIFLFCSTAGFV